MILKQGGGSTVELTDRNTILKTAHDHEQYTKLRNAVRFHKLLGPHCYAPKLILDNDSSIEMEYVEDNTDRSDIALFQHVLLRNAIHLLLLLKEHDVYHTDLTEYNYIVQNNRIVPVDWSEARFGWETAPNKREGMDADWLFPSLLSHVSDTNRIIRKWLAISPHIKHLRGFGGVLDLGCLYGEISGMALCEGFHVLGIDNGAFDKDWKDIAARNCYGKGYFQEKDIGQLYDYKSDIVFMLSSWSHFVEQTSFTDGEHLLRKVLDDCGILFFENHLYGDGPGHESIKTENDHIELFKRTGATAVPITTIPVGGRPFSRTVYKVQKYE